ncbi:hypothetical protein BXZ70DRAFT_76906 [Cristinia sonorae]|uniref:F-box domain-containing protein n=1 Tax=Cristinia sonorae TaxID=1940300 RepID=A0A8K0UQH9_9AGAR|nr:hypothetical protein BXZ70DRAFT_76906 [Cristinia sonorae]
MGEKHRTVSQSEIPEDEFHVSLAACERCSAPAPVPPLSVELWERIMVMATDECRGSRGNIRFGLVSRHWRYIALGYARIWTSIIAGPQTSLELLTLLLNRSRSSPITVEIRGDPHDTKLLPLWNNLHRITHLKLLSYNGSVLHDIPWFRHSPAPLLQCIDLIGHSFGPTISNRSSGSPEPPLDVEGLPSLRRLRIDNDFMGRWPLMFASSRITHLELAGTVHLFPHSEPWVFEGLRKMTSLETLKVNVTGSGKVPHAESHWDEALHFPHLKDLYFSGAVSVFTYWLGYVELEPSVNIHLECWYGIGEEFPIAIHFLLRTSWGHAALSATEQYNSTLLISPTGESIRDEAFCHFYLSSIQDVASHRVGSLGHLHILIPEVSFIDTSAIDDLWDALPLSQVRNLDMTDLPIAVSGSSENKPLHAHTFFKTCVHHMQSIRELSLMKWSGPACLRGFLVGGSPGIRKHSCHTVASANSTSQQQSFPLLAKLTLDDFPVTTGDISHHRSPEIPHTMMLLQKTLQQRARPLEELTLAHCAGVSDGDVAWFASLVGRCTVVKGTRSREVQTFARRWTSPRYGGGCFYI